jgi:eukaryotic-like serine/threonine-protein kinase
MIGTKLAHYEITSHVGSGGMGDVYQATDLKLGRSVAIKFLPEVFSHDNDRVARFEREARVLASLNHPHIAAIYGLEESGDRKFLVMEFIEGETLAQRIERGPIPIDESLEIAAQIVEALEAAHEKGIIHRDLKPANVKITAEGRVKLLDFGLAKAFEAEVSKANQSQSPTFSIAATNAGVILGTAAYMSPEQAKGRPVDKRADIWAFGVVFYEMLTGERLFKGDSISEILAGVIKEESRLDNVPLKVRRLIKSCLEKDPRKRLRDIGDVWRLLDDEPQTPVAVAPAGRRVTLGWMTAALFFVTTLAASFFHFRDAGPIEQRKALFEVPSPSGTREPFALSPDGRYLAMEGKRPTGRLWVRPIDSSLTRELPGTEGGVYPFWSPDSIDIGFFANGKLKKIALASGVVQILSDADGRAGGSWGPDGTILFRPGGSGAESYILGRVAETGGVPVPVTKLAAETDIHRFPAFLPDGKHFLYLLGSEKAETGGIYVGSVDGAPPVRLLADQSSAEYVPSAAPARTGFILFTRGTTLMALPFDPKRLQAVGEMFPLAEQVNFTGNAEHSGFTASANGVLAYVSGAPLQAQQLVWRDRNGNRLSALPKTGAIRAASISPDGRTVATSLIDPQSGAGDYWLMDVASGALSRFTSLDPGSITANPVWSPDAKRIAYYVRTTSSVFGTLYSKPARALGQPEPLVQVTGGDGHAYDWSPDGKFIAYAQNGRETKRDIWLLPVDGDRKPIPYLNSAANEDLPQFSPFGAWMAYVSDESGQNQVYIQTIPPNGTPIPVSVAGGSQPRWRRDGRELFYVSSDQKMIAVPIQALSAGIEVGMPHPIFEDAPESERERFFYQPSADGQRFLVMAPASESAPPLVTIVLNWQAGLKK